MVNTLKNSKLLSNAINLVDFNDENLEQLVKARSELAAELYNVVHSVSMMGSIDSIPYIEFSTDNKLFQLASVYTKYRYRAELHTVRLIWGCIEFTMYDGWHNYITRSIDLCNRVTDKLEELDETED